MRTILRSLMNVSKPSQFPAVTVPANELKANWLAFLDSGVVPEDSGAKAVIAEMKKLWADEVPPRFEVLYAHFESKGNEQALVALREAVEAQPFIGTDYVHVLREKSEEQKKDRFQGLLTNAWNTIRDNGTASIPDAVSPIINMASETSSSINCVTHLEMSSGVSPIEELMRPQSVLFMWGCRNVGKSSVTLDIIRTVLSGGEWCSHQCTAVPVLYLCEMSSDDLLMTCDGIGWDINAALQTGNLKVMMRRESDINLMSTKSRLELEREMPQGGMVVVDTISGFADIDGRKEASEAMSIIKYFWGALRRTKSSALLVHHTRKEGDDKRAKSKWRSEDAFMGSSKWCDHGDRVVSLHPQLNADGERIKGKGRVRFDKTRGTISYPWFYTIDGAGVIYKPDTETVVDDYYSMSRPEESIITAITAGMNTLSSIVKMTGLKDYAVRRHINKLIQLDRIVAHGQITSKDRYYTTKDIKEGMMDISNIPLEMEVSK